MTTLRRGILACLTLTVAIVVDTMSLSPAHAGGPGTVYVYGNTYTQCTANLSGAVKMLRANGYQVTGVQPCRRTGDGSRYFGEYVVN